jgi:prolipoprotein diacylglyceryltransferase
MAGHEWYGLIYVGIGIALLYASSLVRKDPVDWLRVPEKAIAYFLGLLSLVGASLYVLIDVENAGATAHLVDFTNAYFIGIVWGSIALFSFFCFYILITIIRHWKDVSESDEEDTTK